MSVKKKASVINTIGNVFSWIIVIFIIGMAGLLALSKFNTPIKVRVFAVLSGSMEPALNTGGLLLVKEQPAYEVGDIITAVPKIGSNKTYTHRITGILNRDGNVLYQTKGDANEEPDSDLTQKRRTIGKVIFHIPHLGRLVIFSQTQMGFMILIIIPATLLIYNEFQVIKTEVIKLIRSRKKTKPSEEKPKKKETKSE